MRAMLITAGSRGDVEPFAALARHLARRGHEVRLVAPAARGVSTAGIDLVDLGNGFEELVQAQGVSPLAAMRAFRATVRPLMTALLTTAARAVTEYQPDLVVSHPKILTAPIAAAAVGIPHVVVEPVPSLTATREFPAPGTVSRSLGPLNRLSYAAATGAALMFRGAVRTARKELAAPMHAAPRAASLLPISPVLLQRPSDWPATAHLTGHWVEPSGGPEARDPELDAFLGDGDVLYAGFGSMSDGDPTERTEAIIAGARAEGLRVLLATGWGGLAAATGEGILVRASVSHAAVLPRVAAAIHHGGAGTCHAVARAGIPQIIAPFIADQPFWAQQLRQRGLAPAPLDRRRLDARGIAAAIRTARTLTANSRTAAETIRGEDGLANATELLEAIAR